MVWCIYPATSNAEPPFRTSSFWKCFYPKDGQAKEALYLRSLIAQDTRSPGRSIVVGKSSPAFRIPPVLTVML